MTRPPDLGGTTLASGTQGARAIVSATRTIFAEAGLRGFWIGNGLNVIKIFPVSLAR